MKNEVSIKYLGGIDDREVGVNLTGSSTLMTVDLGDSKVRILTDLGIFQGGAMADKLNAQIDENAAKADYVIITHAHMDHIGRLPQLIKKGFKGKVLMTEITKELGKHMLTSHVVLTRRMIEELEEGRKKRGTQLKEYFRAVKEYNELKTNLKLKKEEKISKIKFLDRLRGTIPLEDYIFFAKGQLTQNKIEKESDISDAISKNDIELLFDESDIAKIMDMTEIIEVGEEIDLDTRIVITDINDERVNGLMDGFKSNLIKKVYVAPHLKNGILAKWKKVLDDITKLNNENKNLRTKLTNALKIISNSKDKKSSEYTQAQDLLNKHEIKTQADIDIIRESCQLFPYSKEDIKKFASLLEGVFKNPNEKIIESFKLKFYNAGHIEGSIQAAITFVTKKVDHTLNHSITYNPTFRKEHTNFLLTGDLGKFTQANLCGTPDVPEYKFDYVQIESTYADRNHPDKDEEFKKLLYEINSTHGKTLIAAFSLQRTQEIIVELLQNKLEYKALDTVFKDIKIKIKPLKEEFLELEAIENPSDNELERKLDLFTQITQFNDVISELQKTLFTGHIIMDSPLSDQLNKVFIEKCGDKYRFLSREFQKEIFGKEIVRILERGEYRDLYTDKRMRKKDLIISSSGMLEGGSIINHLKSIISDPHSKLIFTGYQAENTLGNKILAGATHIDIDGNTYAVKCQVVQVRGYSSHIGKDDLIDYSANKLNYSKKAKLALVHGTEARFTLADEIDSEMKKTGKKVEKIIPKYGDEIKFKI